MVVDVPPVDIVVCMTLDDDVYLNISSNCGLIVAAADLIISS